MTVSTAYGPITYAGNGSTTAFSVTWPFFTGSLVVTLISSAGVETVKTLTTHYTVSGGTDSDGLPQTGTVTMLTAPASGETLQITRWTQRRQTSTWTENDAFPQKTIEAAFDKGILIAQEIAALSNDGMQLVTSGATDYWDAESKIIRNVADAVNEEDAVNYGQLQDVLVAAGAGDVVGPASASANEVPLYSGTTGKILKAGSGLFGATIASASGAVSTPFQPPYQITPIEVKLGTEGSYGSSANANIFHLASWVTANASGPAIVAVFGEGIANAASAEAWGGNFVGVSTASTGTAIAAEINPVVTASGGIAYGLVVASAGDYPTANALQIQANTDGSIMSNGIVFNDFTRQSVSGSLIKAGGSTAAIGVDLLGSTFNTAAFASPGFSVSPTGALAGLNLTTANIYGGEEASSGLSLVSTSISTSDGSPSGDYVRGLSGGSERWRLVGAGQMVFGHTASISTSVEAPVQVHGAAGALAVARWSADASGATLVLAKSRGAVGTNTIVQSGDALGSVVFAGANGSSFDPAVSLVGLSDTTPGASGDMPGRLSVQISADGSASPSEVIRATATVVSFPLISTTASAANAFLQSGSTPANSLLRSTSSRRYKQNIETLDLGYAERLLDARPVWYRSKAAADNKDWSWYGLIAEELAEIDPRLVHYAYTNEDWEEIERQSEDAEGNVTRWRERVLRSGAVKVADGVQYERLTVLLLALVQRLWSKSVAPEPEAEGLDAIKARHLRLIDDDAEAVRLRYITPGAGQALTYQEKFAQAGAVQALGETAANALSEAEAKAQFPTLAASVGIEAATLWDVAELVLSRYAAFCSASYDIERARLVGKAAVRAASNEAEVRVAYGAVTWPTPA